jgi:hypothetical protein
VAKTRETEANQAAPEPADILRMIDSLTTSQLKPALEAAKTARDQAEGKVKQLYRLWKSAAVREGQTFLKPKKPAQPAAPPPPENGRLIGRLVARLQLGPGRATNIAQEIGETVETVLPILQADPNRFHRTPDGKWELVGNPDA